MLRPRKKYTVFDLQQLKGKRCLTHIHVKSPQEALAAEAAGIDLMSCSFDSPEAQARLRTEGFNELPRPDRVGGWPCMRGAARAVCGWASRSAAPGTS